MQQGEREEKDGKEEENIEKKKEQKVVESLTRLKAKEKEVEEQKEPLVRLVRYDSSIPNALDSILPRGRERDQATRSKITQGGKASGEAFLPIQVRRSKFLLPPMGGVLANKHVKRITLFAPQDFVFQ